MGISLPTVPLGTTDVEAISVPTIDSSSLGDSSLGEVFLLLENKPLLPKLVPDWNSTSCNVIKAPLQNGMEQTSPSWKLSLPHVLVATIVPFLFGYHLGVVNEPLENISTDLGFNGDTLAEGLVVSMCLGGAFVGSLLSGSIADGVGRRRAFHLCALPMIIGASISTSTNNLVGMLLGRFLVGTGLGTYGSFIQIAICCGLIGALLIGTPVKDISGWWRICFWVSTIPAAMLAIFMEFFAESHFYK